MGQSQRCVLCGRRSRLITSALGVCRECIRSSPERALAVTAEAHRASRARFGLPGEPPRAEEGVGCVLCFRECRIPEGGFGYCGLRTVRGGRIRHMAGTPARGLLHWYRDPLPTNCVADWVCTGSSRRGQHNLAVFYASCTLDCLFCQNWHFRTTDPSIPRQGSVEAMSAAELAQQANQGTHCVCYFGGDPGSQMPHALASAKYLADKGVTVCWETAGTMNPRLLKKGLARALETGGCVKFDLKAFDENLHLALTGGSNNRTLDNFAYAAEAAKQRPSPPAVVASTLLVPGYVDAEEVASIAGFIAAHNPETPYALLAFHPHFEMIDLPPTSRSHAEAAHQAARSAGLSNVRIGNLHLLSHAY
ncbi:MAG: radical SAM protein [Anaerolineales bacterium]